MVAQLSQALRDGFQAVAAFQGAAYLDCVERQQALCLQIAALDQRKPTLGEQAAVSLRALNSELRQLGEVQAALIEHGSRSVRCFQRVWALGAPAYGPQN
ncbi:MAG TPA: hypothetical protein VN690_10440 [Terriglobales bacterium]|nr:hypothetical protein [Terriglobales bacterium]